MIRLEGVSKSYGDGSRALRALVDIDLTVAEGEVFGVIGRSGAGKSTLIRCVNLLERPSAGRVFVASRELTALSPRELAEARRSIGMVFQQPSLLSSRTVAGNVALPLELAGVPKPQQRARVDELLSLVGLTDKAEARGAQLSGGQRQRATIARALAHQPAVLLCDEATSALDPATTRSILGLLRDINKKLGITILLITHEMDVVKSLCDRVAILEAGKLIEQGTVDELFARPRSELARSFVRSTRQLELPDEYLARLGAVSPADGYPVLRVELSADATASALISRLARQHELDVDLLAARTDHTTSGSYGVLLLELRGSEDNVARGLTFLRALPLTLEVLGHVPRGR